MLIIFACLLSGVAGLYFGADFLVRGAGKIALRLGLSPLFIGLTIVSMGTSLPEFFVSMLAAVNGNPDISVGNVVGSNIANIGLVLGLSVILRPIRLNRDIIRQESLVIFFSVIFMTFCIGGNLNRLEGLLLTLMFIAYLVYSFKTSGKDSEEDSEMKEICKPSSVPVCLFQLISGMIMLKYGADFTVEGAVRLAKLFSIPDAVIGASVVAVGTSLPELFTSLFAVYRGENDISIGNVLGSNVFNILGIMGPVVLWSPVAVSSDIIRIQLPAMILFAAVLLPVTFTGPIENGVRIPLISKREGVFLTFFYLLFLVLIYS